MQGCGVGSSSERTRTAITAALKKKLKDVMGEFGVLRQKLQQEYRFLPLPIPLCTFDTTSGAAAKLYSMQIPTGCTPGHAVSFFLQWVGKAEAHYAMHTGRQGGHNRSASTMRSF